jgi:hypothetical protein
MYPPIDFFCVAPKTQQNSRDLEPGTRIPKPQPLRPWSLVLGPWSLNCELCNEPFIHPEPSNNTPPPSTPDRTTEDPRFFTWVIIPARAACESHPNLLPHNLLVTHTAFRLHRIMAQETNIWAQRHPRCHNFEPCTCPARSQIRRGGQPVNQTPDHHPRRWSLNPEP